MELEASNQTKQERSRTRWTASLDKILADLVVKQIQLGNRPSNAQARHETVKVKDCPIYEQLCTIFIDSAADRIYAQCSHYEELDKSIGTEAASCPEAKVSHYENPSTSKSILRNISTTKKLTKNSLDRKGKQTCEMQTTSLDQDTCNAMAEALLDMVAVSRLKAVVSSRNQARAVKERVELAEQKVGGAARCGLPEEKERTMAVLLDVVTCDQSTCC
ncbi:cell cycle checkpoint protein RAD17 [Spatholobus suberectus]|nr:cell cycle checkpoint protein RAD17 [Spatholobus suberectus]